MTKLMRNRNSGVTLVELMLYVALFMIFITGVVFVGIRTIEIRAKSRVEQNVIAASKFVMKRIAYEIRNASAINSVSANSLSLATTDATRNPVVFTKTGNKITIGWTGGAVCTLASPCDLTSDDVIVSSLLFTNMSDGGGKSASVKYSLTIRSVNNVGRKEWDYTKSTVGSAEIRSK